MGLRPDSEPAAATGPAPPSQAVLGCGGTRAPRLRQFLPATQASLAVVLVAVAVLLAATLDRLSNAETGFAKGEMLVVELRHGSERYRERQQLIGFYDDLLERAAALPGVDAVGASYDPPLRSNWYQSFAVAETPVAPPAREAGALFVPSLPAISRRRASRSPRGAPSRTPTTWGRRGP